MDGVLADFDRRVVEALQDTCPQLRKASVRTEFKLLRAFPECEREIRKETHRLMFFRTLPVIDYAIEGWKRIEAAGFTPRVCSSPLAGNLLCAWNKRAWLKHYFGREVARRAIIDTDKAAQQGIALIDDRADIAGVDRAPWQLVLFDTSYNRLYDAARLYGWRDPQLPALLQSAQDRFRLER
jgi:5'(3')-deoxyribonucleotidase